MNLTATLAQSDGVSLAVTLLLLAMSVASWVVILYKSWLLHSSANDLAVCKGLFWQATDWSQARAQWQQADRHAMFWPLLQAINPSTHGGLATLAGLEDQLTRHLREALQTVRVRLQWGQDVLATIGATAPFVGLLGTVWGIYHALTGIATAGQLTIERVAGPVGEALVMTAAGLAVALPAVLAFNVMGRVINRLEQELEGFAHDLREL